MTFPPPSLNYVRTEYRASVALFISIVVPLFIYFILSYATKGEYIYVGIPLLSYSQCTDLVIQPDAVATHQREHCTLDRQEADWVSVPGHPPAQELLC